LTIGALEGKRRKASRNCASALTFCQSPFSFFSVILREVNPNRKHCFHGKLVFFSPPAALSLSVPSGRTSPVVLDYSDFKEYPNS